MCFYATSMLLEYLVLVYDGAIYNSSSIIVHLACWPAGTPFDFRPSRQGTYRTVRTRYSIYRPFLI